MGMYEKFLTTKPHLIIGQRVRVVGEYASDWPDECIVTGIEFNAVRGVWNIAIMSKDDIEAGYGSTDGFAEDDLQLAHLASV